MNTITDSLKNDVAVSAASTLDGLLRIEFKSGARLTVINSHFIKYAGHQTEQLEKFRNSHFQSFEYHEGYAVVRFEDGLFVHVGLKNEDYVGPEAIILERADGTFVVEN